MQEKTDPPLPGSVEAFLAERAHSLPGVAARLEAVTREWDLRPLDVLQGGWNSLVILVEAEGEIAVLKLPAQPETAAAEAVALDWWGGDVGPRVLRTDEKLGALLMERLLPGTEMIWAGADDTARVAPLLARMHESRPRDGVALPRLADVGVEVLSTMRENGRVKRGLVDPHAAETAESVLGRLFGEQRELVVLHGDAVPPNVLETHNGLRVIDPRPCVGDPTYDAAYWSVFSGYGEGASSSASLLAHCLGLDETRVLTWAWALAVNRLLQIVDSTYPAHAELSDSLRRFIVEARSEVDTSLLR